MLIDLTQHTTRRGNSSCQPQEDLIANHLAVETEEKFIQVCL